MARAAADIGTTDYAVSIHAGRHALTSDEPPSLGGRDVGPAPFELLCAALAACTSITLRMYARRKDWPLEAVHVDVHLSGDERQRSIARTLTFTGPLDDAQRARLADIAERTPVTLTLRQGLPITTIVA